MALADDEFRKLYYRVSCSSPRGPPLSLHPTRDTSCMCQARALPSLVSRILLIPILQTRKQRARGRPVGSAAARWFCTLECKPWGAPGLPGCDTSSACVALRRAAVCICALADPHIYPQQPLRHRSGAVVALAFSCVCDVSLALLICLQMGIEMALPCNFAAGSCNASMSAYVVAYAKNLGDNITGGAGELPQSIVRLLLPPCVYYSLPLPTSIEVATFGSRDGYFLTACAQHEESCMNYDWGGGGEHGIVIGGESPAAVFHAWQTRAGGPADWRRRDVAWPGDASCAPNGVRHGGC